MTSESEDAGLLSEDEEEEDDDDEGINAFHCPFCPSKFAKSSFYKKHIFNDHPERKDFFKAEPDDDYEGSDAAQDSMMEDDSTDPSTTKVKEENEDLFSCEQCNGNFFTQDELNYHVEVWH